MPVAVDMGLLTFTILRRIDMPSLTTKVSPLKSRSKILKKWKDLLSSSLGKLEQSNPSP
jgi:hypothetical protein